MDNSNFYGLNVLIKYKPNILKEKIVDFWTNHEKLKNLIIIKMKHYLQNTVI